MAIRGRKDRRARRNRTRAPADCGDPGIGGAPPGRSRRGKPPFGPLCPRRRGRRRAGRARETVEGADTYGTTAAVVVEAARRLVVDGAKPGVLAGRADVRSPEFPGFSRAARSRPVGRRKVTAGAHCVARAWGPYRALSRRAGSPGPSTNVGDGGDHDGVDTER